MRIKRMNKKTLIPRASLCALQVDFWHIFTSSSWGWRDKIICASWVIVENFTILTHASLFLVGAKVGWAQRCSWPIFLKLSFSYTPHDMNIILMGMIQGTEEEMEMTDKRSEKDYHENDSYVSWITRER